MRYEESTQRLVLRESELAGAVSALGLEPGPLAPAQLESGPEESRREFEDALASLQDAGRKLLQEATGILADPRRTVDLTAIDAAEHGRRAVFARREGDGVAMLAGAADATQLGIVSAEDVLAQIAGPLRLDGAIAGADERIELDARAVVALIAFGDALRAARMAALSTHGATPDAVTAAQVAGAVADSAAGDPRWAVGLIAGVLPFDAAAFMDAPTTGLALQALAAAGVLAVTESYGGAPALYTPTEAGWGLIDTLLQADSRVALTVYELAGAGEAAYEAMLFARGAGSLLLFVVSPGGGGVATLTAEGFARVAGAIAG